MTDTVAPHSHGGQPCDPSEEAAIAQWEADTAAPDLAAIRAACPMCGRRPNAHLRKRQAERKAAHDAVCLCPDDGSDPGCNFLPALLASREAGGARVAELRKALALADSMIRSGERHSAQSEALLAAAIRDRTGT